VDIIRKVASDKQQTRKKQRGASDAEEIVGKANPTRDYRDLLVWQKGMALTEQIYKITQTFPTDERFDLIPQMRRAAISIPSNIAEGQARHTTKEFIQFISHAEGSVAELDTQLTLAIQFGYSPGTNVKEAFILLSELRRILNSLRRKLNGNLRQDEPLA
jgi:four helix bundle protein